MYVEVAILVSGLMLQNYILRYRAILFYCRGSRDLYFQIRFNKIKPFAENESLTKIILFSNAPLAASKS